MKLIKPPLIDELVTSEFLTSTHCEIDGKWYIAKAIPYVTWRNIVTRIYHSLLVLGGRAGAYQFAEDRRV